MEQTSLEPEEKAYTARGAQIRKGRAVWPDGKARTVYAGIADTYWTIPAHGRYKGRYVRGFVTGGTSDDPRLRFKLFNFDESKYPEMFGHKKAFDPSFQPKITV